jgi:organic radical activating enzyme
MTLDHIDIYINNLCNRTCEGCVTYSNFAFTGHYDFKVSEDYLNKWSEILHLEEINLLGGEPFLHSDLLSWVTGVKSIFKNTKHFVLTTGLGIKQLRHHSDQIKQIIDIGYLIDINVHDKDEFQQIVEFVENTLLANTKVNKHSQSIDSQPYLKDNFLKPILYNTGITNIIRITPAWFFMNNNVRAYSNRKIYFYDSDPQNAFDNCPFKPNCAFLDGILYKCPSLVTLKNFSKQIECDERELIDDIETVSPFDPIEKIIGYIDSFNYPVKQCKICPEERHVSVLSNNVKKIKILRKEK